MPALIGAGQLPSVAIRTDLTAGSGEVGTALPYDVLFLDIIMPRLDGATLCMQLRGAYGVTLPIVAVTANGNALRRNLVMEMGFSAVISKPISVHSVRRALEAWA